MSKTVIIARQSPLFAGFDCIQIDAYGGFDVFETISAEMFATVPTGDHDEVVAQIFPFQHLQNDHAVAGFSVVIFQGPAVADHTPTVVGGLGELLGTL